MKTVILARHAKSSWSSGAETDFQRPLNKRGLRDAPIMAGRLRATGPLPGIIVTSTATRALTTADLYLHNLGMRTDQLVKTQSIYEAPVSAIVSQILKLPAECSIAMIVGHNPGISAACTYLSSRTDVQMPTCGVACLDLEIDNWPDAYRDCATLRWFDYPKNTQSIATET
ncbi:hypothetical protein AB833_29725 [Chromatiales bacterium (ex Bugula neritina AB1)]|nr:hypothetical protein AB833_29725 [Chromatiales bacterium (ex Bugula neritina AB1)]